MRRLILLLCLVVLVFGGALAQENSPDRSAYALVYEGEAPVVPAALRWSRDGNLLTFSVRGDPMHYTYNMIKQELSLSETNPDPALIVLTQEEQEHYHAARAYAYASPDAQYMVYYSREQVSRAAQRDDNSVDYVGVLALGWRRNATYRLLDYAPLYDTEFESSYAIRWSSDSQGFVIQNYPMYGTGTTLEYVSLENPYPVRVPGVIGDFETVYDLSAATHRLLLPWYSNVDGVAVRGLALWDASDIRLYDYNPDHLEGIRVVTNEHVAGAAFMPEDSEHLLLINQSGIVLHNLHTGESIIIDDSVTSDWVSWAVFAPDRQSVAVETYHEGISTIYVVALTGLIS